MDVTLTLLLTTEYMSRRNVFNSFYNDIIQSDTRKQVKLNFIAQNNNLARNGANPDFNLEELLCWVCHIMAIMIEANKTRKFK